MEDMVLANLWLQIKKDGKAFWAIAPLRGAELFKLRANAGAPISAQSRGSETFKGPIIHRWQDQAQETWVLMTPQDVPVIVNGNQVLGGIKVLENRDEIRFGGTNFRFYYSAEQLARIDRFEGGERTMTCPRCSQEILEGNAVVECPLCGVLHHQSEQYPCWTYAEHCALCNQSTALDMGYQWTPEGL